MKLIIATVIVLGVIASAPAQDYSVFSWAYWQEGGIASRSEIVRNLGLLAAGAIGLGFGIWRAYTAYRQTQASQRQAEAANEQAEAANEQARIAQQGQFTERFSRAAEHLGNTELPVHLGGIYALWRLGKDSPERDVVPVIDILCAFVRDPPPAQPPPNTEEVGAEQPGRKRSDAAAKLRSDVQAVLKLLGDSKATYRPHLPATYRLDFIGAELMHVSLMYTDLTRANLMDADLSGANLIGADLTRAIVMDADFTNAILSSVNLTNAQLYLANFNGADLNDADLTGADLTRADLSRAENLTQQQLDAIRYDLDYPPELPAGLVLPEPPPEPPAGDAAAPPPEAS